MQRFTQLFLAVDATTSTREKVRALQQYFAAETTDNAVWALYLFLGKTRKRLVTSRRLRDVFLHISDLPIWLFEDCYAQVGDSAETIALLLRDTPLQAKFPPKADSHTSLSTWMSEIIPQVKTLTETELTDHIITWWSQLNNDEIFVLNKILTGAFRVGAAQKLVVKALAEAYNLPEAVLTHRLMGDFTPTADFYQQLTHPDTQNQSPSQPYPFFLASPLEKDRFQTETLADWQAEWKWDGIRAQLIHREQQIFIWSRGEDLITHQFPEFAEPLHQLPDGTVLDGEIISWNGSQPLDFNQLQKRLGRKQVTPKLMTTYPVHFIAYDLLEHQGLDIRDWSLQDRRQQLIELIHHQPSAVFSCSQTLEFTTFQDLQALRQKARDFGAEGLVLKARQSPYLVGRKRGYWWKYKVDPMTLDAVLIYAQAGSGKRANLFTDYTFALWDGDTLVPFTKAYSGLDNQEIEDLDKWIRRHTREKFGPVRSVDPIHVFEIGFEGIAESKRHKSGISVRFPRILRWRKDKPAAEADTLSTALQLLAK